MLKLFRKIRSDKIKNQQFGKYLKYAVGEILLVVIGILIALQINNWNENQKDAALENKYYCRILEEFELDKELIAQSFNQVDEKIQFGKQVIFDLHEGKNDKYTILNNYLKALRLEVYVPRKIAFNDLVSSGNLKILSDVSLKNTLIQYYGELENILRQMNQNRDELVRRSYPDKPNAFGIYEFDYIRQELGSELIELLPQEDWVADKNSPIFRDFQDDLIFILTLYVRHKHHLQRINEIMEKPYQELKTSCKV